MNERTSAEVGRRVAALEKELAKERAVSWSRYHRLKRLALSADQRPSGEPSNPPSDDPDKRTSDREDALFRLGVPEKYCVTPFDKPESWPRDPHAPDFDIAAWKGEPWSVLFTGPCGVGKTMLAVELLLRLSRPGGEWHCGAFVRARYLCEIDRRNDSMEWRHYANNSVALVDDLGRGYRDDDGWDEVGELFAQRYDQSLPTICTSNYSLVQIAMANAHLADRLSEGLVVPVSGDSRRLTTCAAR